MVAEDEDTTGLVVVETVLDEGETGTFEVVEIELFGAVVCELVPPCHA